MKVIRGTIQVKSFSVSDINRIKEILNNCGLSEQGEYCKCFAESKKLYRNRSIRYRGAGLGYFFDVIDMFVKEVVDGKNITMTATIRGSARNNVLSRISSSVYRLGLELGLRENDAFALSNVKYAIFRFV